MSSRMAPAGVVQVMAVDGEGGRNGFTDDDATLESVSGDALRGALGRHVHDV